jgi:glycosyltransferase involved in cell wall biosynthesis
MRVLFLCKYDWANMAYTFSKSLNKVGVYSRAYAAATHKFTYPERATSLGKLTKEHCNSVDIIIFVHSKYIETGIDLSKKIVGMMHGGSHYRQNHEVMNKKFNPIVDVTFCSSDLLGFGAKNEICYQPPVDTDLLQPVYSNFEKRNHVIIGHYPTSTKGYDIIQKVINDLNKNIEFRYSPKTVSHLDHIKRVSECDIYIEDMSSIQGTVPLTTFGITTLECASLGKIVCTRFPDLPLYEKLFGKCGIQITNDEKELKEKLTWVLSLTNNDFVELQKSTRKWVEERHSLEVIGNWLKKELEKIRK